MPARGSPAAPVEDEWQVAGIRCVFSSVLVLKLCCVVVHAQMLHVLSILTSFSLFTGHVSKCAFICFSKPVVSYVGFTGPGGVGRKQSTLLF